MKQKLLWGILLALLATSAVACRSDGEVTTEVTTVTETESVADTTEVATETDTEIPTEAATETDIPAEPATDPATDPATEPAVEVETDPPENTRLFNSNVSSQKAGTDFETSDLAKFFTVYYGAGELHTVKSVDGEKLYAMGGVNEMFAYVDGSCSFTVDMASAGGKTMAVVRGVRILNPIDRSQIPFTINNYYEEDGDGSFGGGGICARISDGRLFLTIKVFDPSVPRGIKNHVFVYDVDSTLLTFADDAKGTVYILAGDKLITAVRLSGSVNYFDFFEIAMPITSFAACAELVDAEGNTVTLENTLVADHPTQVAVATRAAELYMRSVTVSTYSAVTVPEEFYRPAPGKPQDSILRTDDPQAQCIHIQKDQIEVTVEGKSAHLYAYGWSALKAPLAGYGYSIDGGEIIRDEAWTVKPVTQDIQNALDGLKAADGGRYRIDVTLADLAAGEHTVRFLYILADGTTVYFDTQTFTVA